MAMFQFDAGTGEPDRLAPTALHTQISDAIRAGIARGQWQVGGRLPAEPELATMLGVSRGTVRRALSTLIDEGLLVQTPGRGTFVAAQPARPQADAQLSGIAEDFARQGLRIQTTVLRAEVAVPPVAFSAALHVLADEPVVCLTRVRLAHGAPVALLNNFVRADLAPGLEGADLENRTLFEILETDYGLELATARRDFAAVAATPELAERLAVEVGSPVLRLSQVVHLADGRPVEASEIWTAGDRVRVSVLLERPGRDGTEL